MVKLLRLVIGFRSSSFPEKNAPCRLMLSSCGRDSKSFTAPTTCLPTRRDLKFGNHLSEERFPAGWHIFSLSNRKSKFSEETEVISTPSKDERETWQGCI